MWTILKVFIEFVTILFAFLKKYFGFFFWLQGMWDLNALTRDQIHIDPAEEGVILTTGPPGKSSVMVYLNEIAFIIKEIENG